MLGELVEVVNKLSEVSDRLQQAKNTKRERITNYFCNIEKCLQDSAEQLKKGTVPTGKWAELETCAWELPAIIGKEIGEEKAKSLALLLFKTANYTPTDKDIQSIETAAGKFRGLANTIALQPVVNNSKRRRILIYTAVGAAGMAAGLGIDRLLSLAKTGQSSEKKQPLTTEPIPSISWDMYTFLGSWAQGTILGSVPQRICKRVKDMTNGGFNITPNSNGDTEEILNRVNNGTYKSGYSGTYYGERYKALYFGCAIPFGLNPQEQNAWLYYKKNPDDAETYVQSIYKKVGLGNIISLPAGATGAQMGGWFKKPINSESELKNLTMRLPGLGGTVLQKYFGVTLHSELERLGQEKLPLDVCIEKLKRGEFGAVEWTGPHDDLKLGLDKAANFYYYPGWWEPGTTFDLQINKEAWNSLPSYYREVLKVACFENHMDTLTEYEQKNRDALKNLPPNVKLIPFDDYLYQAFEKRTKELLKSYAYDPVFGEVYQEWENFREQITWSQIKR